MRHLDASLPQFQVSEERRGIKGCAGRVLEIDLAKKEFSFQPLGEEIARLYIGGKGYGTRLLYDRTEAGIDPLGPKNLLIFATGPLNGSVAPQSNRFAVICKSPLTGGIGNATCGGNYAYGMKRAGIDVIVVSNRSERPVRIEVNGDRDEVEFFDATDLWGKGTYETQEILGKKKAHAVIGPAGENMVLYAGIVSNERIAGRTGVGAVMGSKRLKAISVTGTRKLEMDDPEAFKKYTKEIREMFKGHPVLGSSLKRFGTAGIVNTTNGRGMLPTRNFQRGHFDEAMSISGEFMEDNGLVGVKSSCLHCPVTCGRDVLVDGKRVKGPEYETVALLGSNLEIGDLKKVSEWNFLADDLGMDTISLGATLSFAMELQERGMFDVGVRFGDPEGIHNMDPKSLTHRMLSKVFEKSGPMMRIAMGIRGKPMLWFEKWLTYITGETFSSGHLQEIGGRIFNLKRMYNLREGFTAKDDTLPPRILNESIYENMDAGHPLSELLPRYYKLRGWNADGVPYRDTLDRLQVRV